MVDGSRASASPHNASRKRERRLRALVLVHAIGVQPVAAAAGGRVVERLLQVVLTEKPAEGAARVLGPAMVAGHPARVETGRDHRARLDRLLIERGLRPAASIEAVRADRREVAVLGATGSTTATRASAGRPSSSPRRPSARPETMSACDRRALQYVRRSSNHGQSRLTRSAGRGRAAARRAPRAPPATLLSPWNARRYSSMPSSANAQARGLVKRRDGRQRGVEQLAAEALPSRDRSERPTRCRAPTARARGCPRSRCSSSQCREYDMKFRKRPRSRLNAWLTNAR